MFDPKDTSLFLDIDGTLAEFKQMPGDVGPTPRRTALLQQLSQGLGGRIGLISGRALSDMDRITERAVVAASGVHGLERRRPDGIVEAATPHSGISRARLAFSTFIAENPRIVLEDKELGLVLHYRTAPELAELANAEAIYVAEQTGLTLQKGDMMVEVRTPGANKGDALQAFMSEPPFQGSTPIYIGDDLTDEDAFEAARALGGYGVLVGAPRETAASYGLVDVEAVLAWLEALAATLAPVVTA